LNLLVEDSQLNEATQEINQSLLLIAWGLLHNLGEGFIPFFKRKDAFSE